MGNCCAASEIISTEPPKTIISSNLAQSSKSVQSKIRPKAMANFKRQIDISSMPTKDISMYTVQKSYNEQPELDGDDSDPEIPKAIIQIDCPYQNSDLSPFLIEFELF